MRALRRPLDLRVDLEQPRRWADTARQAALFEAAGPFDVIHAQFATLGLQMLRQIELGAFGRARWSCIFGDTTSRVMSASTGATSTSSLRAGRSLRRQLRAFPAGGDRARLSAGEMRGHRLADATPNGSRRPPPPARCRRSGRSGWSPSAGWSRRRALPMRSTRSRGCARTGTRSHSTSWATAPSGPRSRRRSRKRVSAPGAPARRGLTRAGASLRSTPPISVLHPRFARPRATRMRPSTRSRRQMATGLARGRHAPRRDPRTGHRRRERAPRARARSRRALAEAIAELMGVPRSLGRYGSAGRRKGCTRVRPAKYPRENLRRLRARAQFAR